MTSRKINARDLIFQVSDMQASPTWSQLTAITKASRDPSSNEESTDTTDYDSAGAYGQEIMQRGDSLKLEGHKRQDDTTGAYDTAQGLLDTHALAVGVDSLVNVRFRYAVETSWRVWTCTVTRGEEGGGNNDKVGYSYSLTRCGAATSSAVS